VSQLPGILLGVFYQANAQEELGMHGKDWDYSASYWKDVGFLRGSGDGNGNL